MPSQTFTSTGAFTVPAGVTSIIVECWGGGGGGGYGGYLIGSSGGSGGSYAKKTLSVTPGQTYTAYVGAGGFGGSDGSDSWFSTSGTVLAKGGAAGRNTSPFVAGQTGSIGDITYIGGSSNSGLDWNGNLGFGGGGGGAAGSTGTPTGGATTNNGNAGAPINGYGGGGGGTGAYANRFGGYIESEMGVQFGGGGGGGCENDYILNFGSPGASGGVVVTWGFSTTGNSNFFAFFN